MTSPSSIENPNQPCPTCGGKISRSPVDRLWRCEHGHGPFGLGDLASVDDVLEHMKEAGEEVSGMAHMRPEAVAKFAHELANMFGQRLSDRWTREQYRKMRGAMDDIEKALGYELPEEWGHLALGLVYAYGRDHGGGDPEPEPEPEPDQPKREPVPV